VSTQVSPQIKILAAVGLVLALVLGASMMLMGRSSSSSSPTAAPTTAVHVRPHVSPAPARTPRARATHATRTPPTSHARVGTHPAAKAPAATGTHAVTRTHAATKAHAKPHTLKAKAIHVPLVAANGLPGALDELLHLHSVVVVALWDPEVPSDRIAMNEAEAGAKAMNAGFLAVNVLDDRVASPLTAVAGNGGLLPSPGVLIYRQPSVLVNTMQGFADRDAVAQAVADALLIDRATLQTAAAAQAEAQAQAQAASTTPAAATPATTTAATTTPTP
jgi:hypothetical protein